MADSAPDLEHPAFRPLDLQQTGNGERQGLVLVDRLGFAEPTFVPQELLPLLSLFDGARNVDAIAALASTRLGEAVPPQFVRDLVRQLDERLVLVSARYESELQAAVQQFMAGDVRPCRHAGSAGYHQDAAALRANLAAMVPPRPVTGPAPRGLIAPHIDLQRGRAGYAAAYGALMEREPADLYVLFGTGHMGPSAPVTGLPLDWQTPLGRVATDRAFVAAVHERLGQPQPLDLFLHRDEHALEFQVLLLQHVLEAQGPRPFAVAAFLCGSLPSASGDPGQEDYVQHLLTAFRDAAAAGKQRVCFVAGADLAHLGPFFGDQAPVDQPLLQRLDAAERQRLSHLQRGEPGRFHAAVVHDDNPDRVCSATSMYLAAALAGGDGQLLHYGQAASADGSQVVSFPALRFG